MMVCLMPSWKTVLAKVLSSVRFSLSTINKWGRAVAGPFEYHFSDIGSVTFSPDGTRVASRSCDKMICICGALTGQVVAL